ncbi:MAG: cupin domain-containing protein [Clostridia bacterium]|nr:cupin domain-containing protein [Clostridia bacterium]
MNHFVSLKEAVGTPEPGHISFSLLDESNGCTNGCCCGVSRYTETEYQVPGCHDDQEGFMVLSGSGYAKIGEEEGYVCSGTAFIVPAGVEHALRTDNPAIPLEVFWFHASC